MLRVFDLPPSPFPGRRPVVTIGMFDGVHLGHRKILEETVSRAAAAHQPSIAITFDIHPRAVVAGFSPPPMITSLEHRLKLFEQSGLDAAVILPFTPELAAMSGEDFARKILAGILRAEIAVLGYDAHFGKNRSGNFELLSRLGPGLGMSAVNIPACAVDGETISSTAVRKYVSAGELDRAAAMLGRKVSVLGTVVEGQGLGRTLGFPTLNLDPHHELHPPRGVYVTRTCCGDTCWRSVTNIGHRPTVSARNPHDVLIESHLLDYCGNLYGQVAEVKFLQRLRDEQKFADAVELKERIGRDVQAARDFFKNCGQL